MFYGYYIVGACVLISMYISGTISIGFTAFFEPIAKEFGWSYTQISFASSLKGLETGLLVPFAGMIMDRWGPRKLIISGAIISSIGMFLLSRVESLPMFYFSFVLISLGLSAAPSTLLMTVTANWFNKNQSLAMGLTASGVSLGGLLLPIITYIVDTFGWRNGALITGLGMLAIPLPLALIIRHKPEEYGLLPDGETAPLSVSEENNSADHPAFSTGAKEALLSITFWVIAIAFFSHVLIVNAVQTHIMPYLSSMGVKRSIASLIGSLTTLIGIVGRTGFGWLGDRVDKRKVVLLGLFLTGLGAIVLVYVNSTQVFIIFLFVVLFGIGWGGCVPMLSGLLLKYFGRERLGTIVGCAAGVMQVGVMLGAPFAGWIFDRSGSYHPAFFILGGFLIAVSFIVYFTLNKLK